MGPLEISHLSLNLTLHSTNMKKVHRAASPPTEIANKFNASNSSGMYCAPENLSTTSPAPNNVSTAKNKFCLSASPGWLVMRFPLSFRGKPNVERRILSPHRRCGNQRNHEEIRNRKSAKTLESNQTRTTAGNPARLFKLNIRTPAASAAGSSHNKAHTLILQRKFVQAINYYSEIIAQNPNYQKAYDNRGFFLFQIGNFEKALEDWKKALQRRWQERTCL